jgi:hypothetical protein
MSQFVQASSDVFAESLFCASLASGRLSVTNRPYREFLACGTDGGDQCCVFLGAETIDRDSHRLLSGIRNCLKTVRNRGTPRFVAVENIDWRSASNMRQSS